MTTLVIISDIKEDFTAQVSENVLMISPNTDHAKIVGKTVNAVHLIDVEPARLKEFNPSLYLAITTAMVASKGEFVWTQVIDGNISTSGSLRLANAAK